MKKKLQLFLLLGSFAVSLHAQNINNVLNGGFENWPITSLGFSPDNYNQSSTYDGQPGLERVTGSDAQNGTYAVKLTTSIDSMQGDTNGAYILMGTFDNNPTGGVPYNGQPDSLVFYSKHTIMPNDSAGVLVIIFNADTVTAINLFWVSGTQASYKRYSYPITTMGGAPLSAPADSLLLAAVSSQFFANKAFVGSTFYLDNMSFIGTSPQMPNADFENWTEITYSDPQWWESSNSDLISINKSSASKTTDSKSGNYALKLDALEIIYTNDTGTGSFLDTSLVSYINSVGRDKKNGNIVKFPYDVSAPISLEGWYKYTPNGMDTASISIEFSKNGIPIDNFGGQLMATSTYTKFSFTGMSNLNPDSASIEIFSGNNAGSSLIIDDIVIIDSCSSLTMNIGPDTALCNVDTITFTADAGFDAYTWNGNNTDTMQTYSVSTAKTVSVIATNSQNCKFTDTAIVTFCAGINNIATNVSVKIFPNPTNDIVNININDFNSNAYLIELNDLAGRLLIKKKLNKSNSTLKMSNLENGLYLLNIKDLNGVLLSSSKLILNK